MVRITAKRAGGFWRCGVFHPPHAVEHAAGRFSAAELARLRAEPMLSVEETEAPVAPAKQPTKPPAKPGRRGRAQ